EINATVTAVGHKRDISASFGKAEAEAYITEWFSKLNPGPEKEAVRNLLGNKEVKITIVDGPDVGNYTQKGRPLLGVKTASGEIYLAIGQKHYSPQALLAHEAGHKLMELTYGEGHAATGQRHGRPWTGDKIHSTDKRRILFEQA